MRGYLRPLYSRFLQKRESYYKKLFGHKRYRKFVIISDSRTGSTLLMSLLNSHSNVLAEGELFKDVNGKSCNEIWNNFFGKQRKNITWAGFKLFYFHPRDSRDQEVWKFIEEDKDIVIIHLTRKNILQSFVSKKIGLRTRKWTENVNRPHRLTQEEKTLSLSSEECLAHFEYTQQCVDHTKIRFHDHRIIQMEYEDLKDNMQVEMDRIFLSLDLPSFSVSTNMKKQNPEKLQDLILNYPELKQEFQGSKWEYMFN